MAKDALDKAKDIAQILSFIAVPILVAGISFAVQTGLNEREVRKDYVQMSLKILSSKDTPPELRQWAVSIVNASAPAPLPERAEEGLIAGTTIMPAAPGAWVMEPAPDLIQLLDRIISPSGPESTE
jgi:hypothetical protein